MEKILTDSADLPPADSLAGWPPYVLRKERDSPGHLQPQLRVKGARRLIPTQYAVRHRCRGCIRISMDGDAPTHAQADSSGTAAPPH